MTPTVHHRIRYSAAGSGDRDERGDVTPGSARACPAMAARARPTSMDSRVTISGSGAADRTLDRSVADALVEPHQLVGLGAGATALPDELVEPRPVRRAGSFEGVQVHGAQPAIPAASVPANLPSMDGILTGEGVLLDARPTSAATRLLAALIDLLVLGVGVFVLLIALGAVFPAVSEESCPDPGHRAARDHHGSCCRPPSTP